MTVCVSCHCCPAWQTVVCCIPCVRLSGLSKPSLNEDYYYYYNYNNNGDDDDDDEDDNGMAISYITDSICQTTDVQDRHNPCSSTSATFNVSMINPG